MTKGVRFSMFGKHFASMYSGSMFGKPAAVFAVWGYVIATMRPSRKDGQCYVELNPSLLASTFASTEQDMLAAIGVLCSPDPRSRTKAEEGRRLLPLDPDASEGPMQFRVVNGSKYRALRDEEERRTYLREAKRKERSSTTSETVNRSQPPSSQVEVEVEVEVEEEEEARTDNVNGLAAVGREPEQVALVKAQPISARIPQRTSAEKACHALVDLWNGLFGTRIKAEGNSYQSLVDDFVKRCQGGTIRGHSWAPCQPGEVLMAAVVAYCTGREFWRTQAPAVLLRTGAHAKTSGNGATTGGTDHVRELLTKPQTQTVKLPGSALSIVSGVGILHEIEALGVMLPERVSQGL